MALNFVRMSFIAAICLFLIIPSHGYQAAPPPAAHHHSAGFTQPEPIDFDDHDGWTQIFDGKTMQGWDGSSEVWHVEDGALVAESSPEHPSGTTNIIWRGGEPANFELKVEMKLEGAGANGGIQYRSQNVPPTPPLSPLAEKFAKWNMKGYQADFDYSNKYTGQLYEQSSPRGIVAWRGQMVQTDPGKKPRLLGTLGSSDELKSYIKVGDWNQIHLIARDRTMMYFINGYLMSVFVDDHPTMFVGHGYLALQLEGRGDCAVHFRNIWLKTPP